MKGSAPNHGAATRTNIRLKGRGDMRQLPTFHIGMFRKAQASGVNTNCVQVARYAGWVVVRNSKNPTTNDLGDPQLWFTEVQFDDFQNGVRSGLVDGHDLELWAGTGARFVTTIKPKRP